MPPTKLSATLKFTNLTSPTYSAIAPFLTFFQLVKFIKVDVTKGFEAYGSVGFEAL